MQSSSCNRQFVQVVCINLGAPRLILLTLTDSLYCCGIWSKYVLHDFNQQEGLYRVSQEEMSIFWEAIVLVIVSKKVYIYTRVVFQTVSEIELFLCTGV